MFRIGLCSSAFLSSPIEEVIARAKAAGFQGIEWAGSPHLPAGDPGTATRVMLETLRAGLTVVSYAPLYRITPGGEKGLSFEAVLASALAVHAPIIRLYAGPAAPGQERLALASELVRLGGLAGAAGISLAVSPSPRSWIPGLGEALALMAEADHPFVRLAWEPPSRSEGWRGAIAALGEDGSGFAVLRARQVDAQGLPSPLETEGGPWTEALSAYAAKAGPRDPGHFVLLGGTGGSGDATLESDLAFARRLSPPPEPRKR